jgi:voltage-gated potassium channel
MFRVLWLFWGRGQVLARTGVKGKALLVFMLLLWYAASGFLYFELPGKPDLNWLDALWWALVTMATVGYGDIFPVTPAGRYLVGVPTMIFGIGFLGYLISEIAGSLIASRSRRLKGMEAITSKDHLLLVNYNHVETALKLIRELRADASTRDKEICIVDESLEELPPELLSLGIQFVKGDPTRIEILRRPISRRPAMPSSSPRIPGIPTPTITTW